MSVVTLEDLAMAISNRVNIDVESAMGDANFVMDLFGFEDRIIDNVLEPEDRQLFYILEEEGMLIRERRNHHIRRQNMANSLLVYKQGNDIELQRRKGKNRQEKEGGREHRRDIRRYT